jgi:hypothetical protein
MAKRQHYVPRLLLRQFSTDNDKLKINIHLMKTNNLIINGVLYDQAQEKYLYGLDQKLEKMYGLLESVTAPVIYKLSAGSLELSEEEKLHIKLFIMYQLNRTPGSVDLTKDSVESMIKNIAFHDNFLKDYLSEFSININEPYMLQFCIATKALHVILDLKIGLLETNGNIPFVLGQNPVIRLNPFLKEKKWQWSTQGLVLKGLMVIMPISPKYFVILYDSFRYALVNKSPKWVINDDDINLLNKLQYLNTYECIYFNYTPDMTYYEKLALETKNFRNDVRVKIDLLNTKEIKAGTKEEIVNSGLKEYPIKQIFHFYGIKVRAFNESIINHNEATRDIMPNFILDEINRRKSNGHGV